MIYTWYHASPLVQILLGHLEIQEPPVLQVDRHLLLFLVVRQGQGFPNIDTFKIKLSSTGTCIAGALWNQSWVTFQSVSHSLPTWSNDSYSTIIPWSTLKGNDWQINIKAWILYCVTGDILSIIRTDVPGSPWSPVKPRWPFWPLSPASPLSPVSPIGPCGP